MIMDDRRNDVDIESEELVIGKPIMTRSGGQVKVWSGQGLKFRHAQNGKPGHTNLLIKAFQVTIHIEFLPFTNKQTRTIK